MRLTERKICYPSCDKNGKLKEIKYIEITNHGLAEEKLCQLEDIEDELGIDLNIFFKAFNGLFYKKDSEIKFSCHIAVVDWAIYILEESMEIGEGISLRLKDYGKTWALTKKELN